MEGVLRSNGRALGLPGHHMHRLRANCHGIAHRLINRGTRLGLPPRQGRQAKFALAPTHRVDPQHRQPGLAQRRRNRTRILVIGPMAFHRRKSCPRRRPDRLRQRQFGPQKPQIGRESRHQRLKAPPCAP